MYESTFLSGIYDALTVYAIFKRLKSVLPVTPRHANERRV